MSGDKDAQEYEANLFKDELIQNREGRAYAPYSLHLEDVVDVDSSGVTTAGRRFQAIPNPSPFTLADVGDEDNILLDETNRRWTLLVNGYCESSTVTPGTARVGSNGPVDCPVYIHVANHGEDAWGTETYPQPGSLNPTASAAPNQCNQHMIFNKDRWEEYAKQISYTGETRSYFDHYDQTLGGASGTFAQLGLGFSNLDGYLGLCQKNGVCLQGSLFIEKLDPDKRVSSKLSWRLEHSPHIRSITRPVDNRHCYVGTDLAKRLLDHRYKADRYFVYGPGKSHGEHAFIYLIDGRFKPILEQVGMGVRNTDDLARCPLPLPVAAVYKVTWNGPGLGGAVFVRVF